MDASNDNSSMLSTSNPVKLEEPQSTDGLQTVSTSVDALPKTMSNPPMTAQPPAPVSTPAPAPTAPPSTGGPNQPHHPVAEFLYQLTKMLTDDNNEIIEWVEGRIKVHFPERLETEVLHKYFRHSKFASFQRQLNYFGFRKIAGKGKMSPCSYVNESATSDIRSLLLIKRKTNGSAARKAMAQRALNLGGGMNPALGIGLPGLAGAPGFALGSFPTVGQQLQLQKQLGLGLIDNSANNNVLSQLLMQNQHRHSLEDLQQLGGLKPAVASIEQLQAQIATLTKQQNQGGLNPAFNAAAFNFAAGGATAAYTQLQHSTENPATAALNASAAPGPAMPATAAMNISASGPSSNLFESATNLKALIGNDLAGTEQQKTLAPASALNNLIPNGASMGNLLASSNRLSSLLSLNSFLSREPSLADFAMIPNGAAQFAAFQQQQANIGAPTTAGQYDAHQAQNSNPAS
eukprot:CAMPEP_0116102802 /NCGR_PEP_ID=MMETSP0327-20121206/13547_1 /TAXON_ID=44447 /ORGANISM="Pseudo-nitzschia delicatissima, Strain B596" /LENGTH=460 /DNA_ID=CAMNT_0003594873 /DNA_START=31 /DNA_END=1413 /DNA_ORIENTATION=+